MKIDTIRIAGRIASLPTALLTATLAFTAFGQQGGSGSGFSGDELKALPTDGWITNGGNIYIVTGADDVFVISVDTGERLWKYGANLDQGITTVWQTPAVDPDLDL